MTRSGSGDDRDPPDRGDETDSAEASEDSCEGDQSDGQESSGIDSGPAPTERPSGEPGESADDTSGSGERVGDAAVSGDSTNDPGRSTTDRQWSPNDGAQTPSDGNRSQRASAGGDGNGPSTDSVTIEDDGVVRWFLRTEEGGVVYVRDLVVSVLAVGLIALILFGISGVWPPLVAVESGSMEDNMHRGDMIFVVDEDRFVGDNPVDGTGIVTAEAGAESDHSKFGQAGDVIIFRPDGNDRATPVIHRAGFWVEEGENWVDDGPADPALLNDNECDDLRSCPATHDGFITIGDANSGYDQAGSGANTDVVRPEWVEGKGMLRIPWLGYVRLTIDEVLVGGPSPLSTAPIAALLGTMTMSALLTGRSRRRC